MKKVLLVLFVASIIAISCVSKNNSVNVDSTVVDSVQVDTAVADTACVK